MKPKTRFKQTEIGTIPEDWDVRKAGEFVDIKHGYAFKGEFFTDIPNGNILLTPGNFRIGGGFKKDKLKYTKEESPTDYVLKEDEIVVTMTDLSKEGDTLGYSAKVPASKGEKYLHNQRIGLLKFKSKEISPNFMYWVLRTKKYNFFVVGSATGSTVKHTSPDRIKQFVFGIPTNINEQSSIAKILSSLDEKIELNRQMNSTLEQTGQALFKRWFVDFEFPDEEGKPYKSSGGEMVDSELGEIPKGWKVGTLGDICEITMGQSPPGETYNETEDGLPFYQGVRDFGFRFPTQRVYCTEPTRFAEGGDVLLSVRAPVGSLNIAEKKCAIGRGVAALRLKAKQQEYLYYLLLTTRTDWNKFEAEGTVFGSASKTDVHEFKVILPPERLRDRFGSALEPFDKQITTNEKQFCNLAAIRDALLPKLMSGQIRVPT